VRWIDADLNESLAAPDESFDVILCCEVIHCLENPRAVAREFFRLLRSNGTVIISAPNNESVRAIAPLWIQGHFVGFGESTYPSHKTALVKTDLDRLLGEAGFERRDFFYSNHGGLPKKPALTWQQVSGGWLGGNGLATIFSSLHEKHRDLVDKNGAVNSGLDALQHRALDFMVANFTFRI
jgi:2-polyprenyl-3-methyl-5-hydroxy-6-metoxy-1,4-benzoquinol methylase